MEDVQKTLELLSNLQKAAGWSQSGSATTGITAYSLEAPSKKLFPVLTPFRNRIPRKAGPVGGTAVNWKAITGINTANLMAGVSEGNRGGIVTTTTAEYNAAYKGIGLEEFVTFEAEYAAAGFEDLTAGAQERLLQALMIEEERIILMGNATALGTTPTPVATLAAGGALTAQATLVYCVALTGEGYRQSTVAAGVATTSSRTRAGVGGGTDTLNLGQAAISAASNTITTAGGSLTITATVTAVRGASAYAWFIGPNAGAALLHSITTVNAATFSTNPTGTQASNAAGLSVDHSGDSLVFNGMIQQISASGANGYYKSLDGATLTVDGAGGITEFENLLQDRWDNYRLTLGELWVNSAQFKTIKQKVLSSSAPVFRINIPEGASSQSGIVGGSVVGSYLSAFGPAGSSEIPIRVHPNLPPGTILGLSNSLPYPVNGVPSIFQIETRQEYYAIEWPRVQRKFEYGVYADEVLKCYFPPSCAILANVA